MPIYEYRCENCGHDFEAIQKMSDDPLTTCPECGAEALRKLISAAGFQLKGSGWYVTDFRDKKKSGGDAKKGADKAAKTDSGGGGEAKPAAKDSGTKKAAANGG